MLHTRFKLLMVLLVVILVLASLLFALLTYWLGQQVLPAAHGTPCRWYGEPLAWRAAGIADAVLLGAVLLE